MSHSDRQKPESLGSSKISDFEGTGDGENRLSKLSRIKSEKEGELIGGNKKTVISPSPVPSRRSSPPAPSTYQCGRKWFGNWMDRPLSGDSEDHDDYA